MGGSAQRVVPNYQPMYQQPQPMYQQPQPMYQTPPPMYQQPQPMYQQPQPMYHQPPQPQYRMPVQNRPTIIIIKGKKHNWWFINNNSNQYFLFSPLLFFCFVSFPLPALFFLSLFITHLSLICCLQYGGAPLFQNNSNWKVDK